MEALYALRPTSVQRHFGASSSTLLISGSQLGEAAVEAQVCSLAVEVDRFEVVPGVLRAAEELDVALTLVTGSFFDTESIRQGALATSAAVMRSADALRFESPLCLATVVDAAVNGLSGELTGARLLEVIDAGFTSFMFPMPQEAGELRMTLALMETVAEFALGIEVIEVPEDAQERALELFRRCGVPLTGLANHGGIARRVLAGSMVPAEQSFELRVPGDRFLNIIARSLDVDPDEALFTPIDAVARDRIEALAYSEVRHLIRQAGLIGSGSGCLAALSWAG